MKKILAFAGSNSPTSINHELILHVVANINEHPVEVLELRKLEIPMYSIILEKEGYPNDVKFLYEKILEQEALIISVNEYNHNISGFFKNILDWLSRMDRKFLTGKKILLMSTSPGKRGGASALEYASHIFNFFGGEVLQSFSLPLFYENFDPVTNKIKNEIFELGVLDVLSDFSHEINQ